MVCKSGSAQKTDKEIIADALARIRELERGEGLSIEQALEMQRLRGRVAELEGVLKEAYFFAKEDFPGFPAELLAMSDVCATERYLAYWKALNRALPEIVHEDRP